jgi:hypothetical protein
VTHAVLLGDSIFDNAAYVGGGPDVARQLRSRLPQGWRATLCAVDGAVTSDVLRQLERVPADATHLVISVGGNDALGHSHVLDQGARSMLETVMRVGLPTGVCTIYDGRFPEPIRQRLAMAALTVFNDRITRHAFARGLPLIDLRLVCSEDEDYANPIEPSARGGEKIASAIATMLARHDFEARRTRIFT